MLRRTLIFFLLALTCLAQSVPLGLHEAVGQALASNAALAASRGRVEQARGQKKQAGLAPNPRLYLQTEDVRWWGSAPFSYANSTEEYGYVGQVIETAGKRGKRVGVADADLHGTELQDDLFRRRLVAQVSIDYWIAASAARIRDLYREDVKTYDEDVRYLADRVREGMAAPVDQMRLEIERDRISMQSANAARDYEQALIELYRAMGRSDAPADVKLSSQLERPHRGKTFASRPDQGRSKSQTAACQRQARPGSLRRLQAKRRLRHALCGRAGGSTDP